MQVRLILVLALAVLSLEGLSLFTNYRMVEGLRAKSPQKVHSVGKEAARVKLERILRRERWDHRNRDSVIFSVSRR